MRIEALLRMEPVTSELTTTIKEVGLVLLQTKCKKTDSEITIKDIKVNPEVIIKLLEGLKYTSNLRIYKNEGLLNKLKEMEKDKLFKLIEFCIKDLEENDNLDFINKLINLDYNSLKLNGYIKTPEQILNLMLEIASLNENEQIVNPYSGLGGEYIYLQKYIKEKNISNLHYYGQESNMELAAIGELIAYILNDDVIEQGNSILGLNTDKKFDCCISIPPFISKIENVETYNKISRDFDFGKLARSSAWITMNPILNNLKDDGRAIILAPIGITFRSGSDEKIREKLLNEDMIETIIELPSGVLSPNTGIATCILVLNKNKKANRKGKVQLIDLSNYLEKVNRRENAISQEGIDRATSLYREFKEQQGISKIVDKNVLAENDYNLQPSKNIKIDNLNIVAVDMIELEDVKPEIRRGLQIPKKKLDEINQGENRTHYYIGLRNVLEDGSFRFEDSDKVRVESKWKDLYEVEVGDIIIPSKSSNLKIAIVDESVGKAIISANMMFIRLNNKKYKPEVLKYFLESEIGQKFLDSIKVGSVVMSISPKDMEKLNIPNIGIDEQLEIVDMIEKSKLEYIEAVKRAENKYKQEKEKIDKKIFS